MADPDDRLPEAWLFTREGASVHMELIERPRGLHLTVSGPGHKVASHDFPTRDALLAFTRQFEMELREQGFQLQAVAERRSSAGRRPDRMTPRSASGRRRSDRS